MSKPSPVDPVRFKQRLEELGLSQSEMARRIGVSQPTIARLATGEQFGSKHLHRVAFELDTTPAYLTGETDDPSLGAVPVPSVAAVADQLGLVEVPEIDLALGMGGTYLNEQEVQESIVHFPESMIRPFTSADLSMLVFARGDGDSMSPTISDHDIVLIDRSQSTINRQDKIWAIAYGDIGMIKRVRAMPDGSYKIMSDNPVIEPEIAVDGEMFVIGRVVLALRGM